MRTRWVVPTAIVFGLVLAGGSVQALNQYKARPLDQQNLGVIPTHTTKQPGFVTLSGWGPSDSMHVYARGAIAATLSVTVRDGPVDFRMFLEDVNHGFAIRMMRPDYAAFDPGDGTVSSSFTFVAAVAPGNYTVNVAWRSPTGVDVTMVQGTLVVQYGAQ